MLLWINVTKSHFYRVDLAGEDPLCDIEVGELGEPFLGHVLDRHPGT